MPGSRTHLSAALTLIVSLGGCVAGPHYRAPEVEKLGVPSAWHAPLPHGGSIGELWHWWTRFDDPAMTLLIAAAEKNSPTIQLSTARVRAARASVRSAGAAYFPAIEASGAWTRSSTQMSLPGAAASSPISGSFVTTSTQGTVDSTWEIDLFGGTRRSVQSSKARLASASADWHDARVTLAAEVASVYAILREYQQAIALYQEELSSRETTQRLTAVKIQVGAAPRADALQTDGSTADSAGRLDNYLGLYEQQVNQLVQLTALPYAEVEAAIGAAKGIPQEREAASLSLPASVISQRPDVRSSERLAAAASADIGVAIADALPSLTLIGSIGINALRANDTTFTSHPWSFGPTLKLPIFTGGRLSAKIETARAAYDSALASWRSVVLRAVQEVEDALSRIDAADRRAAHAELAAQRYGAYFASINDSYRLGRATLLELETVRLTRLSSDEVLLAVHLEQTQARIALYKAAGGGWDDLGTGAP